LIKLTKLLQKPSWTQSLLLQSY